jgi:hypothetical protein
VDKVIHRLSFMGITSFPVDNLSPLSTRLSPFWSNVIHRFCYPKLTPCNHMEQPYRPMESIYQKIDPIGYPHIHSPYYYVFLYLFIKRKKK